MSLRRADESHWRSLIGGQSITAHIARLYTLSAVVLLSIVIGLLYWVESRSMAWDDVHDLVDKVHQLRLSLRRDPGNFDLLAHEVKDKGGVFVDGQHYIYYSRILDEAGRVLIETPGTETILPAGLFPPPADLKEIPEKAERKTGNDGRSYLVISAWGDTGGANPARRLIQVALDDTEEVEFITHYQRVSLLLVLIGILLSAGIGVLIARSGMRPLARIARITEQITASRLDKRVVPERWPRELTTLATAFDGMLDRLDDSYTRLARFSAELAHDLRTPIHALMGQTEVALANDRQPEEYRRVLESNLEEYQRLARMTNELLFLARVEDPKAWIERRWLDACQELEAIREFHEALAEDYGVSVTCQGQADLYADPILFRRAVTNLLSNALHHTPKGGQIILSVEKIKDDVALVSVSDTGCGIAPEDLPGICERKYCPDRGPARCAEGNGLGLAIVRSIAELHGGTVAVASTFGEGATVTLRFPTPQRAGA